MSRFTRASAVLVAAIASEHGRVARRDRRRLDDLLAALGSPAARAERFGSVPALAGRLERSAGRDQGQRSWLVNVLGRTVYRLAPARSKGTDRARADAWRAVLLAVAKLFPRGVRPLGRLPFVDDGLLDTLVREARRQLPGGRPPSRRTALASGPVLRDLAADPRLRRAAGRALGHALAPAGIAVYLYDPPRSHLRPHLDASQYEIIVHLVLEHTRPKDGSRGSGLVVYRPAGRRALVRVRPGEAVVLGGRGSVHEWQRLGDGERRTMVAIGFARSRAAASSPEVPGA